MKRDFDFDQCPPLTFHRNMLANSASVRILIKGGKVVNDDCTHEADVYIENGIIQQVNIRPEKKNLDSGRGERILLSERHG